jgi:hypothetical protein
LNSSDSDSRVPWPIAVSFLIRPLGELFTLAEVYSIADPLRSTFPKNNHVEAKIRQSLQVLRDRGKIAFEGTGRYRKLTPEVRQSVRLDFREASHYASRSQIARVAVEAWAATNVACWRCNSPLLLVPANTRLLDATCRTSSHEVQIKAVSGLAADTLLAAAHGPMKERLSGGHLPDYLIVSYDLLRAVVVLAEYLDGTAINQERLRAREPLSSTARRAGWVGSTIDIAGLERHVAVGPSFHPEVERWP